MSLGPGSRLGPYDIVARVGVGGMGEVYRATDTKLGRDVALKLLPAVFAADPERLARFEREAKVLASLNHPGIAHLYGFESGALGDGPPAHVLGMELVEGEDLAERLKRGPIPVEEAVAIARQVAEALEEAHEKGIVHRDLKPANVKVTPDGKVKVLDFGLARAYAGDPATGSSSDLSQSPTLAHTGTAAGIILGTAAYMSPEQARGRAMDKRADVWAFGVLVYEMLTAHRLFAGETVGDTLAAVLRSDPDWSRLPGDTPPAMRRLLRRCLERDPRRRLRDIGEARIEIQAILESPDEEATPAISPATAQQAPGPRWLWPGLAALGLLTSGILATLYLRGPTAAPAHVVWFQVQPKAPAVLPSLSPDGLLLAYQMSPRADAPRQLWLRPLGSLEARALPGTQGLMGPVSWSGDGRAIAFAASGQLQRAELSGGPPQPITELPRGFAGAWSPDGTVLFGTYASEAGVYRVASTGGAPTRLTKPEQSQTVAYIVGGLLPDRRHFLYSRFSGSGTWDAFVGSLDPKDAQPSAALLSAGSVVQYVPRQGEKRGPGTGWLVFVREGVLLAQRFDAHRLAVAGDPVQIAEGVEQFSGFAASDDGTTLAFSTGAIESRIVRFDRSGAERAEIGAAGDYGAGEIAISADDSYLALDRRQAVGEPSHLWVVDLARGAFSRLNPGEAEDYCPAISHGGRVAFTVGNDIFVRRANGVGDAERLITGPTVKHANGWSPDDAYLIYDDHDPNNGMDLYALPMAGDRKSIPILTTTAEEGYGRLSPDGHWLVYVSNESGRYEVYVRDFVPERSPAYGNEKLQVSVNGGDKPLWSHDGSEIFYLAPDDHLTAVRIRTRPKLEAGAPNPLFKINPTGFYPFAVTASGDFIVNNLVGDDGPPPPITVVRNWQAGLP